MSTKHIISFSIPAQKENYKIYGECCIEIGTDLNGQSYPYPRFYDLKAEKIIMKKDSRSSGKLIASDIPCGTPGSVIQIYDDGSIFVNWKDKHASLIHYGIDLFKLA